MVRLTDFILQTLTFFSGTLIKSMGDAVTTINHVKYKIYYTLAECNEFSLTESNRKFRHCYMHRVKLNRYQQELEYSLHIFMHIGLNKENKY